MADDKDQMYEQILGMLISHYVMIGTVFAALPIPLELPSGLVEVTEARDAVERAAVLSEDQPMPEARQDQMRGVCLMWLCAMDMLGHFQQSPRAFRAAGALKCLHVMEDHLLELAEWLLPEVAPDSES